MFCPWARAWRSFSWDAIHEVMSAFPARRCCRNMGHDAHCHEQPCQNISEGQCVVIRIARCVSWRPLCDLLRGLVRTAA